MPAQLTEVSPYEYRASLDGTHLGKVIREKHVHGLDVWVAVRKGGKRVPKIFHDKETAGDQLAVDHVVARNSKRAKDQRRR